MHISKLYIAMQPVTQWQRIRPSSTFYTNRYGAR